MYFDVCTQPPRRSQYPLYRFDPTFDLCVNAAMCDCTLLMLEASWENGPIRAPQCHQGQNQEPSRYSQAAGRREFLRRSAGEGVVTQSIRSGAIQDYPGYSILLGASVRENLNELVSIELG